MKRLLIYITVTALIFSCLGSCTVSRSFSSLTHEYLVSALGFDQNGEELTVALEAVIVNAEDTNAEKKNELLTGNGSSLQEALSAASKKAAQPIELSHCAVAVIGKSVSAERFGEICDYLYNERQITLSILLVCTESAAKLLSSETVSSVAVGYDIMSMAAQQSKLTGIDYKNRFYELESKRKNQINVIALPFFEVTQEEYFLDGIILFKNNAAALKLDSTQTSVYALATDSQGAGSILIDDKQYNIESAYTVCEMSDSKTPEIRLITELKIDAEEQVKEIIEAKIEELFVLSQQKKLDIFGIGNILYHKERDFFGKIENKYDSFYKNMELTVTVK